MFGAPLKSSPAHKLGLLFPALTWLFIQFTMSGIMVGAPANAMQVELCTPFGIQEVTIDLETGEPVDPLVGVHGCDWCQSFGLVADTAARGDIGWVELAREFQLRLPVAAPPVKPLYLAADYHSRAPPVL
jgi:hypothetical protein